MPDPTDTGHSLTFEQLVQGFRSLGVRTGDILLVHASLSSLGDVVGGPDTVIDALLDTVGPDGTLLMPTHPARDGQPFDPERTPSDMGTISETFRLRSDVLRSRHPFHPIAASGRLAGQMLRDHELSAVPDGPDTPYGRLIALNGRVLHIGCDLDTLTLLHTVEADLDLPYLRRLSMDYVAADGTVRSLGLERCPGGHRGGVLKFDRLFREEGAMAVGRVGKAVCRLIDAPKAADIMRRELGRDPAFALDDNAHCADCVAYRKKIEDLSATPLASPTYRPAGPQTTRDKVRRLNDEAFRLSVPLWRLGEDLDTSLEAVTREAIRTVEVHARWLATTLTDAEQLSRQLTERGISAPVLRVDWRALADPASLLGHAVRLGARHLHLTAPATEEVSREAVVHSLGTLCGAAGDHGLTVLLANAWPGIADTPDALVDLIREIGSPNLSASFDPVACALAGHGPFYQGLYEGPLRRMVAHVEMHDVVTRTEEPTRPGHGNAQIVEIISNFRCRSYDGLFCLWPFKGQGPEAFRSAATRFWQILESI